MDSIRGRGSPNGEASEGVNLKMIDFSLRRLRLKIMTGRGFEFGVFKDDE